MNKNAKSSKIIGIIIFAVILVLLVLIAKNKGDFSLIIEDIKSVFGG